MLQVDPRLPAAPIPALHDEFEGEIYEDFGELDMCACVPVCAHVCLCASLPVRDFVCMCACVPVCSLCSLPLAAGLGAWEDNGKDVHAIPGMDGGRSVTTPVGGYVLPQGMIDDPLTAAGTEGMAS